MTNLDALLAPTTVYAGTPCNLARTLAGLPEPYKTALNDMLALPYADGGLTDHDITARMKSAGLRSSDSTVHRHRHHKCSCPREDNE